MPCVRMFVFVLGTARVFPLREGCLKIDKDGGEDVFEWEGGGQVEIDPCDPFTDSGSHFEEAVLQGVKLSLAPLCALEPLFCQGVKQHIGGTVQQETELVGLETVTGGPV